MMELSPRLRVVASRGLATSCHSDYDDLSIVAISSIITGLRR